MAIAACSIHDSAFDTGLLTVQQDFTICRASALEALLQPDTAVERLFGGATIRERLIVPAGATGPHPNFLKYYAREIFRG